MANKIPLLGTGLSGLVGSKFVEMYSDTYEFENLDLSTGVNILNEAQVHSAVEKSKSPVIVHFAAFTDVGKAFEENGNKEGLTYQVNVVGTQNIAKAAKEFGKHLVHISTAYVFDGQKQTPYVEDDQTHPIEWYGQTKAWAEEEVQKICERYSILRIDRPYRLDEFPKPDILHKVKGKLETNSLPPQFSDTSWTPTSIEKFADILHFCVQNAPNGIFHATTEPIFSDYTFALWVKEKFSLAGLVSEGSLTEYLKTSQRPYQRNTALDTSKLRSLMTK
ncbi:MAG TPA: sugar nucleotide-binding protein [Patescibacteria group bacterium]|nr:sugar nucleotide-binding protein [Patescibacteria group bacterium]